MAVKFKTHETQESHTTDVSIRVSAIDNGFVIKAGGPPHHVQDEAELKSKVGELLSQFAGEVARKRKKA
jgi:hypothetical protein